MDALIYVAVVLACIVMSAFFSGSETALLRLPAVEVDRDTKTATGPAVFAVRDLIQSTSRLLVTILVGNNVANIVGASVAAALAVHYLGDKAGIIVASTVMTILVLVFCEVLPKAVAARHPRRVSYTVALPLYLLHQILRPLHRLFDWLLDPLVKMVTGGDATGEVASSSEEILRLARVMPGAHAKGTPLAIIAATAGAAEMTVSEIMVPRTEVVAFPARTPPSELLEQLLNERYTRVPIYLDTIDHITGVVHLKDLVKLVRDNSTDLDSILKPVLRVPERKPILRLLADMQRAFVHVAVVKDEFAVTQGMVTQEDILEELVGEIRDEFDREELFTIRKRPDGTYQALGRVKVLDFNRETGCQVPSERGETLGGLVFNTLGHAPVKADTVSVGDYEIAVVDVSGSRITQVRVTERPVTETALDAQDPG
jgi:putative hemolysin